MGTKMHSFADLVNRSTNFALVTLKQAEDEVLEALQTSGAIRHVKNLQMIQLHRAVIAVGIFSLFESIVQDRLECRDGVAAVRQCLEREGEVDLGNRFSLFVYAVNVVKHGRGRSYDTLAAMGPNLPFRIKRPGEDFFSEGDVSEVALQDAAIRRRCTKRALTSSVCVRARWIAIIALSTSTAIRKAYFISAGGAASRYNVSGASHRGGISELFTLDLYRTKQKHA
jgi:hypothetical protein